MKELQTGAGMKSPWRSRWTLAGMEARATSVKVLASRTSRNGETFGSEEMTEDRITPAEEDSTLDTVPSQRCRSAKASPSSSSTAPGDATNTGSDGKQDSCLHSTCSLVTTSIFAS